MTAPFSTEALLELAVTTATEAGQLIATHRTEAVADHDTARDTKSSPTDPVTAADRAAETVIVEHLLAARPDDGIVGEEGTDRTGRSGVDWLVDPIDGTTNYLYGLPAFAVSVAAVADGRPVAGAVYEPTRSELFTARAGHGAACNDTPIRVSATTRLDRALVATGFAYRAEQRRVQAGIVARLLPQIRDIRRLGSAALDLCAVACGRVDAYYETGLSPWDFAAGWLIAVEAGAHCTDLAGGPPTTAELVAGTPAIHAALCQALTEADDGTTV